jgi:putative PIN family toxin of toxin-antitoxin system
VSRIRRVVFDTSTLVSAALRVGSVPHQALMKALATCDVCASVATLAELGTVMGRRKFDRYLAREVRLSFVALITRQAHLFVVPVDVVVAGCRDAGDDKFLALVLAAEAQALVSSDEDLLVMHPWRGIPVMKAAEFLNAE